MNALMLFCLRNGLLSDLDDNLFGILSESPSIGESRTNLLEPIDVLNANVVNERTGLLDESLDVNETARIRDSRSELIETGKVSDTNFLNERSGLFEFVTDSRNEYVAEIDLNEANVEKIVNVKAVKNDVKAVKNDVKNMKNDNLSLYDTKTIKRDKTPTS